MTVHPLVERAAAGELPGWAEAGASRRAHMARVAALLEAWARALELPAEDRVRWAAAGHLHDVLRGADAESLRRRVPPAMAGLPNRILHGPAAAERLRIEGVVDGAMLRAVAYHTLGHPDFGSLGQALYVADFLEPGRDLLNDWREGLRARMPGELTAVVREILGARIAYLVGRGNALRAETVAFWNSLAREG